jgi:hypothetical protein
MICRFEKGIAGVDVASSSSSACACNGVTRREYGEDRYAATENARRNDIPSEKRKDFSDFCMNLILFDFI